MHSVEKFGFGIFGVMGLMLIVGVISDIRHWNRPKENIELSEFGQERLRELEMNEKEEREVSQTAFYSAMGSKFAAGSGLILTGLGILKNKRKLMSFGGVLFIQFLVFSVYVILFY